MRFVLLFVIFWISAPIASAADRLDHISALRDTDHIEMQSRTLQRSFHIYVRKPLDYDETNADYPAVYLLDGDITYPIIAAYH
ncbi:MAG: hypothetical protein HKP25_06085 [Marinicaulis sp.]|nr:hypothetical protein [Marinicaulis sp.]NNL88623.1 hypothetical protein [Marinicaulis sp.]